jgi:hypothetical protein
MTKEGWRNEVLEARIQDMNLQFSKFEQSLYEQGIRFGVGTDWIVLALSGAGAIVTGGASSALSGAAAGVTGARSAYGKDVLYDKTLPVIIAQMVAQRRPSWLGSEKVRRRMPMPTHSPAGWLMLRNIITPAWSQAGFRI